MAYRFLLESPASLADAASIAVERVDDAQVLVVRPSHGLGVDDPYVDATVAAHSLRVIDSLYDWYESLPRPRPEVRIVLHGGERHSLEIVDRTRMVALIRRDQPWVERSIPHVGEHEPSDANAGFSVGPGAPSQQSGSGAMSGGGVAVAERIVTEDVATTDESAGGLHFRAINYLLVQAADLRKAEDFYQDFLGMTLLGRVRRGPGGAMLPVARDYSWERALQTGELADISFLANGPLVLAVQRVGLGVILNQGVLDMVSLGVDSHTFAQLKGAVLIRNLTVLRTDAASFIFRDPMNVNWEIAVVGSVPLIPV